MLPLGVGINVLPHATRSLARRWTCSTSWNGSPSSPGRPRFFNRFGQLVYREPAGRWAGYDTPQLSIHRGDLQGVLLRCRACTGSAPTASSPATRASALTTSATNAVRVRFRGPAGRAARLPRGAPSQSPATASTRRCVASSIRTRDRRATRASTCGAASTSHPPLLTGATMIRAGWLSVGKMVIYPIRNDVDGRGNQLVNWVAELRVPGPGTTRLDGTRSTRRFPAHLRGLAFRLGSTCRR